MEEQKSTSKLRLLLLLVITCLTLSITVLVGSAGHLIYWVLFESFGRNDRKIKRKLVLTKDAQDDEYYAVIIGAGFSGIGIGIKLHEAGMNKYVILERLSHIGGTWYANQYPGCACDIPSNLYSFSFEPNPQWSYFYGQQQEIAEYLEYCADKYDLRRHIEFNTKVIRCDWLQERRIWRVTARLKNDQEKQFFCRVLISGNGPLSNGAYPTNISGIDKFQGRMCHTAEWDKSINFINKRVAVVGTGSSGVQVMPELHKMNVSKLYVFQRTPAWVIPRIDRSVHAWEKRLFTMFPIIQKFIRGTIYWMYESTALSFTYRLPIRHICQELISYNLMRQVKDKELRKKLTPSFDFGCKRVLVSNDWYPTLQKPNVSLVTSRIRDVTSSSIVTQDGNEYPVDIIVWSTGFQVHKIPFEIFGSNGVALSELWAETIQVRIPNISSNARWAQNGTTVAGSHEHGDASNQLNSPWGVFVDDDQTMVITDMWNHRIIQWKMGDTNGQVVAGGHGSGKQLDQLNRPFDVLIDKKTDSLVICDRDNRRVVRWSRLNVTTQGEILLDNIRCWGLAMDDHRYLYVSDDEKHEVRRYHMEDKNGILVAGGNGNGASLNQLNSPTYIFVDRQQTIYVSDNENHRVIKWEEGATEGTVVAGGQGEGAALTQLYYPQGLFVDALGTLYVVDRKNNRVVRWSKEAKQGSIIVGGNGYGKAANQLNGPMDLSFDQHGNLYVVDTLNDRIQRFSIE
ncbi:unnamed protein product [Rotaria sp. Silwood1]|nr:unnamed protein product [Rotaria sp. Silwood1]CAF3720095.1 unnamed protein product [Rotaria sp. Silwood1]CAF4653574.1 unnamed protein product [Rotaria sp. Silwood1]